MTNFPECDQYLADEMRGHFTLDSNDEVILISKSSESRWSVLTLSKLMWKDSDVYGQVELNEIRNAKVNIKLLQENGKNLASADFIDVVLAEEKSVRIPVESGGALSGFWNVLLAIAKENRKSKN